MDSFKVTLVKTAIPVVGWPRLNQAIQVQQYTITLYEEKESEDGSIVSVIKEVKTLTKLDVGRKISLLETEINKLQTKKENYSKYLIEINKLEV